MLMYFRWAARNRCDEITSEESLLKIVNIEDTTQKMSIVLQNAIVFSLELKC